MHGKRFSNVAAFIERSMCSARKDEKDSSESLWPCITKWTLMELNFLTALMNVFTDFSCWNVQMILNVSCKSGHVRLNCLRMFKKFVGLQPLNCQSKIQISEFD